SKIGTTEQPLASETGGSTEGLGAYTPTEPTAPSAETATSTERLRQTTTASVVRDDQTETSHVGETTEGKIGTTEQPLASETGGSTEGLGAYTPTEPTAPSEETATPTKHFRQTTSATVVGDDQTETSHVGETTEGKIGTTQQPIASEPAGSTEGLGAYTPTEPTALSAETATPTEYFIHTTPAAAVQDDQKEISHFGGTTEVKRGTTQQPIASETGGSTEELGAYTPTEPTAPNAETATPTEYFRQTTPAAAVRDDQKEISHFGGTTEGKRGTTQQPIATETGGSTPGFVDYTTTGETVPSTKSATSTAFPSQTAAATTMEIGQPTEGRLGTTQQPISSETSSSTEELGTYTTTETASPIEFSPALEGQSTSRTSTASLPPTVSGEVTKPVGPTTTEHSLPESSDQQPTTATAHHTTEVDSYEIRQSTVASGQPTTIEENEAVSTTPGTLVASSTTPWGTTEQTSPQSEAVTASTKASPELVAATTGTTFESEFVTTQYPTQQSKATEKGAKIPESSSGEPTEGLELSTTGVEAEQTATEGIIPSYTTTYSMRTEGAETRHTTEWDNGKSETTSSLATEATLVTGSTSTATTEYIPTTREATESELSASTKPAVFETSSDQTSHFFTSPIVTYVYEQTSIKSSGSTSPVFPEYSSESLVTETGTEAYSHTPISSITGQNVQSTTPEQESTASEKTEKSELMESTKELAKETTTQMILTTEKLSRSSSAMEEGTSTAFTPEEASEGSSERVPGVPTVEGIAKEATTLAHATRTTTPAFSAASEAGGTSTFSFKETSEFGPETFSTTEELAKQTATSSYSSEGPLQYTTPAEAPFTHGTMGESMITSTASSNQSTTLGFVTEKASTTLEAEVSSKTTTVVPTTETKQLSTEHPERVSELTPGEFSTLASATEKPLENSKPSKATYADTTTLKAEEASTVSTKSVSEVTLQIFSTTQELGQEQTTLRFTTEKSSEYSPLPSGSPTGATGTSTYEGTTVSSSAESTVSSKEASETSSSEVPPAETTQTSTLPSNEASKTTPEKLPSEELEEKSTKSAYTTESYSQYSTSTGSTGSDAFEASTTESTHTTATSTKEPYETPGVISTMQGIENEATTQQYATSAEAGVTETVEAIQSPTVPAMEASEPENSTIPGEKHATEESTLTTAAGTENARVATSTVAPTTEEVQRSTLHTTTEHLASTTGISSQYSTSTEAGLTGTTKPNAYETTFTTAPKSSPGGLSTVQGLERETTSSGPAFYTTRLPDESQTTEEITTSSAESSEHPSTSSTGGFWTVQQTGKISTTAEEGWETTERMISSAPSTWTPTTGSTESSERTSTNGPSTEMPISFEPDFGTKEPSATESTKLTTPDQSTVSSGTRASSIVEATTKVSEESIAPTSGGASEISSREPETTRRITTEEQPSYSTTVEDTKSTLAYPASTSEAVEPTIQPLPGVTSTTESEGRGSEYSTAGTISTISTLGESTTFMSPGTAAEHEVTTGLEVEYGTVTVGVGTTASSATGEILPNAATEEPVSEGGSTESTQGSTAERSTSRTAEGMFANKGTSPSPHEPTTGYTTLVSTEKSRETPAHQPFSTSRETTTGGEGSTTFGATAAPKLVTEKPFVGTQKTSESTEEPLTKLATEQIITERLTTEVGETTTGSGKQNATSDLPEGITTENVSASSEAASGTTAHALPQETLSYRNKQNGDEFTTYYPSTLSPTTEKYFTVFEKESSSSGRIPSMDALMPTGASSWRENRTTPAPPSYTATMETAAGFTVEAVTVKFPQTGIPPVSTTGRPMEMSQQPPGRTFNPVETSTATTPLVHSITFTTPTGEPELSTTESYRETTTIKYLGDVSTFSTVLSTKEVEEIVTLGRTTINIGQNEVVEVTTPAYTMQEAASTTESARGGTEAVRHTVQMSTEQLEELTTVGTTTVSKVSQHEETTQQSELREPTDYSTEALEIATEPTTLSATTEPVLTTTVVIATNHSVISISNYTNGITNRTVECLVDNDCEDADVCIFKKCINVCTIGGLCGANAKCTAENHAADCTCPPHHYGDPHRMCYPGIVILLKLQADFRAIVAAETEIYATYQKRKFGENFQSG
ncbi:hypothetical protein HUJ05_009506, partial [Dendroctonus ponderosae]